MRGVLPREGRIAHLNDRCSRPVVEVVRWREHFATRFLSFPRVDLALEPLPHHIIFAIGVVAVAVVVAGVGGSEDVKSILLVKEEICVAIRRSERDVAIEEVEVVRKVRQHALQ